MSEHTETFQVFDSAGLKSVKGHNAYPRLIIFLSNSIADKAKPELTYLKH